MATTKAPEAPRKYKYERDDILRRAAGRWEAIIPALVPQLSNAVDAGHKHHVGCPFHPGKTEKNLRVMPDFAETGRMVCNTCGIKPNGLAVLTWAGRSYYEALKDVHDWLDGYTNSMSPEMLAKIERELEQKRKAMQVEQARKDKFFQRELNRLWRQCVPLTHPDAEPGRLYLANRGLALPTVIASPEIRFHPDLEYFDEENNPICRMPAFVMRFLTADGKPGSLQRLYTTKDGMNLASEIDDRKKMMPHPSTKVLTGGAIRLTPISEEIAVAEGFETALAAMELFPRIGCWSLYSATLLEFFDPPRGVKKVIIFADKDRSKRGEEAALKLTQRLWERGIKVEIRYPPMDIPENSKGVDWLDFLNFRKAQAKAKADAKANARKERTAA